MARQACGPCLVEAVLFRPQTGYYPDVIAEAPPLCENLAQNHAFLDGNKRTAFAAAYVFLAINGLRMTADSDAIYSFIAPLYETNRFACDALDEWLRENTKRY